MATACGRPVAAVLREPFWLHLWTYAHLMEREREQAMRDRVTRVDAGYLMALAMNEPAKLDGERKSALEAIERYEQGESARVASVCRRGLALVNAVELGGVLIDGDTR